MESDVKYNQTINLSIFSEKMFKFLAFLACFLLLASCQPTCRFAHQYTQEQLGASEEAQQRYIESIMYWEGKFHQDGVGINFASGLTYDGHPLNYTTGEITGDPHPFSAASKESVHVSLLARILDGDTRAQLLISSNSTEARQTAIEILEHKISSYEEFNREYPGYGGFLPWFAVNDSGMVPTWDWVNRVPSLDNGQLVWGLFALIEVLETQNITDLATRYQNYLDIMTQYASMIFYAGDGNVRTVTLISNMSAIPYPENYASQSPCSDPCYLDDPYEGELFVVYLTLFGGLPEADQDLLWQNKIPKIESVDYKTPLGNITVEKGWWYSAHEKWKFLMLPYLDVDIMERLYRNGEKARTWDAALTGQPGMLAAINDVCPENGTIPGYISAAGIQELAYQEIERRDVLTGYATFPLFLIENVTALLWFDNYLKGPKAQNPYGATEGVNVNGTMISPLTTWDSKMTTVSAILGGVVDINRKVLKDKGVYQNFTSRLESTWAPIFTKLKGEELPILLPAKPIPLGNLEDFDNCRVESAEEDVLITV